MYGRADGMPSSLESMVVCESFLLEGGDITLRGSWSVVSAQKLSIPGEAATVVDVGDQYYSRPPPYKG